MMNLPLAQLPDVAWILIGCVPVAILAVVGLVIILRFLQETRERLAAEIQIGIDQAKQPAPVAVQQPLVVKPADDFVTTDSFNALKDDVEQLRGEVKDGFEKLGEERRVSVGNLHGKIDVTNTTVNQMRGELTLLNQQLQQLLSRQLK